MICMHCCTLACTLRFIYRMVITSDIWRERNTQNEQIMHMDLYLDLFYLYTLASPQSSIQHPASNATYNTTESTQENLYASHEKRELGANSHIIVL